jgi:hypothetical protein
VGSKIGGLGGEGGLMVIFDLPGQMELYVQSGSMQRVVAGLSGRFSLSSCLLELFDATYLY